MALSEGKRPQRNLKPEGYFVVHPEILPTQVEEI